MDIPLKAEAARGGLVIDPDSKSDMSADSDTPRTPTAADFAKLGPEVSGTVKGQWGFDSFQGPTFSLRTSQPGNWILASDDKSALVIGRDDTLHFKSDSAVCVDTVTRRRPEGQ